jgi:thioredoxin 1
MADILKVKKTDEFNNFLSENENVIVKFSAEWCGPCRTMTNVINNLNDDALNGVSFVEVDVDEDDFADVISDLSIRNLPTFIFFKNNEVKDKKVGTLQANEIIDFVKNNV